MDINWAREMRDQYAEQGAEYESSTYYERWSASIEHILIEKSVLSTDEITDAAREVDARWG